MFAKLTILLVLAALAVRMAALLAHALRADHDVRQVEADVGERGQELGVEPRGALVALPAVARLNELVDAVGRERRDQPGQAARVLGDRVRLVELADLRVELRRHLAPVDLEDARVGHALILDSARRGPRPSLSRHLGVDADGAACAGRVPAAPRGRAPAGRLLRGDAAAAAALGVPPGRERGLLQGGEPLTLADGRTITPDAVLGPARPGRTVVLTGDTGPSPNVVHIAHHADLLVHEATFSAEEAERARETMHATAAAAAE